jgi:hypothetical protein
VEIGVCEFRTDAESWNDYLNDRMITDGLWVGLCENPEHIETEQPPLKTAWQFSPLESIILETLFVLFHSLC